MSKLAVLLIKKYLDSCRRSYTSGYLTKQLHANLIISAFNNLELRTITHKDYFWKFEPSRISVDTNAMIGPSESFM